MRVLPGHRVPATIAIGAEEGNYSLGRCETSVDCALWRASGTWSGPEESSSICLVSGVWCLRHFLQALKEVNGSVVLCLSVMISFCLKQLRVGISGKCSLYG